MLPKRKIIKKRHIRPANTENHNEAPPTTLLQRLKSQDVSTKEHALTYIASMCSFGQGNMQLAILTEMINILYQGNNALIYQCLFALGNLCQIDSELAPRLFQLGLAKALVQLKSTDQDLLKPIMVLMIALHDNIPEEFKYLQKGIEASLTALHLSSQVNELVLQFLMRMESAALKEEIYEKLYQIFKSDQKLKNRSTCLFILLKNEAVKQRIFKQALQFTEEVINDINLQSEYRTNIVQNKPSVVKQQMVETEQLQQQGEQVQIGSHVNYQTFTDAVQATEILLETLLTIMEDTWEQQQMQGEQDEQVMGAQKVGQPASDNNAKSAIISFFTANQKGLINNTVLSFMEGQNIVNLALRLVNYIQNFPKQNLTAIIVKCFENVILVNPPRQLLTETLNVGLSMLLKCPIYGQAKNMLLVLGQTIFQVSQDFKECWIALLQLYSLHFNPEKTKVTQQQNVRVGQILKKLIINIPHLQLEEWRGQTIDTVFDVYSNQDFDVTLVQLGFIGLLGEVLERAGSGKKKRFIREVLADIQRFLDYKKKMIKF